jgi:mono/diheme cytochrome c family protein
MFYAKLSLVFLFVGLAAACIGSHRGQVSIKEDKRYEASLFRQNCTICHGPEAEGKTLADGRVIPNLRSGEHKYTTPQQVHDHIANGGNGMVPFRNMLTDREINMLVDFVMNDLRR